MLIIMTALLQWLRGTQADICLCASSHLNSNTVMTAHLCLDAHSFVLLLFSPPSFSPSPSLPLSLSLSLSLALSLSLSLVLSCVFELDVMRCGRMQGATIHSATNEAYREILSMVCVCVCYVCLCVCVFVCVCVSVCVCECVCVFV